MESQETTTTAAPVAKQPEENAFPPAGGADGSSSGMMMLGIVALVIFAVAAWYFMRAPSMSMSPGDDMMLVPVSQPGATPDGSAAPDEVTAALSTQGTSDEVADIEADLNATNLDAIEADIEGI